MLVTALILTSIALAVVASLLVERSRTNRHLRAQALILDANELEAIDREGAFALAREALVLDASARVMERVQELQFGRSSVHEIEPLRGRVWGLAWSDDGHVLLAFGQKDKPAVVDLTTGEVFEVGDLGARAALVGGRILTTRNDGTPIEAWSLTGRSIAADDAPADPGFAAGGRVLITHPTQIRIWNGPTIDVARHDATVWWAAAAQGVALTASQRMLRTAEIESGAELGHVGVPAHQPRAGISYAALSPDGERVIAARFDGGLQLYDRGLNLIAQWHTDNRSLLCAAFSPDGRRIAAGDWGGSITVLDSGLRELTRVAQSGGISCLAFSPDGNHIAAGSNDGRIRVFSLTPPDDSPGLLAASDAVQF